MKGTDFYVAAERLNVDVADRPERDSTIGLKSVDQAFAFHFFVQLLFDGNKHFGRDTLVLDLRLVADSTVKCSCVVAGALDRMGNQDLIGWKRMVCTGADFGQRH